MLSFLKDSQVYYLRQSLQWLFDVGTIAFAQFYKWGKFNFQGNKKS